MKYLKASEKGSKMLRKEALTKIRERYNQRLKEIQNGGTAAPYDGMKNGCFIYGYPFCPSINGFEVLKLLN